MGIGRADLTAYQSRKSHFMGGHLKTAFLWHTRIAMRISFRSSLYETSLKTLHHLLSQSLCSDAFASGSVYALAWMARILIEHLQQIPSMLVCFKFQSFTILPTHSLQILPAAPPQIIAVTITQDECGTLPVSLTPSIDGTIY